MDGPAIDRGVIFLWFTRVLQLGSEQKLCLTDLPQFPAAFSSESCKDVFVQNYPGLDAPVSFAKTKEKQVIDTSSRSKSGYRLLVHALARNFGSIILKTGLLRAFSCALAFSGPLILGAIVDYLEEGVTHANIKTGLSLVALLTVCSLVSTALNTNYNIRSSVLRMKLQATLTRVVFSRSISLTTSTWADLELSGAQINNLVQIDIEQVAGCAQSIHDLWWLPVQIVVAFVLLYLQIRLAFLAGVAVIVITIPINAYIAKRIGSNTAKLMIQKDARIKVVTEAFKNICSLKMSGLENCVLKSSREYRSKEIMYLAYRKYLDALCVLLWASMPVVVPFVTFVTAVLLGEPLSASDVITSIALLNMLIFPMNAFPWVINGFMEARVSARRLSHVLLNREGDALVLKNSEIDVSPWGDDSGGGGGGGGGGGDGGSLLINGKRAATGTNVVELVLPAAVYTWISSGNNKSEKYSTRGGNVASDADLLMDIESQNRSPLHDDTQRDEKFAVQIDDLNLKSGDLCAVVGGTGAGKTALLLGILGELHCQIVDGQDSCSSSRENSISVTYGRAQSEDGFRLTNVVRSHPSVRTTSSAPGVLSRPRPKMTYCAQVPPMHSGSIRSNIIMGGTYDPTRYREVVEGCCLLQDLMASNWSDGDLSDVGSAGSNLSGGQRLRIGVARALYSTHPIVLLDDPFSALDGSTGAQLMRYLTETVCGKQGRIVILSTHTVSLLKQHSGVTSVLVLQHGRQVAKGSYSELCEMSSAFQDLSEHVANNGGAETQDSDSAVSEAQTNLLQRLSVSDRELLLSRLIPAQSEEATISLDVADLMAARLMREHDSTVNDDDESRVSKVSALVGSDGDIETVINGSGKENQQLEQKGEEQMASGRIRSHVYKSYFKSVGLFLTLSVVAFTFLTYFTSIAMALWLAYWATHQNDYTSTEFIVISSTIVISNVIFALFRSFLFAKGGLNACITMYNQLTSAVFHADITFFENTSVGRLTNRFGKDTNTIDDSLPFIINSLLAQFFIILGGTFVMAYNDPIIIVLLVIVAVFHYRLQHFYRQSSRELRRLDSVYRSPVYTIFTECMSNAPTIRALGRSCLRYYDQQLSKALDNSLRVTLSLNIASQWLGVRLQLLGALVNTALATMIVINGLYNIMPVSAGLAGLSLIYSFSIVNNLNSLVNAFAETEQEMISVERVLEYCNLPSEFGDETDTGDDDEHGDDSNDAAQLNVFCGITCKPRRWKSKCPKLWSANKRYNDSGYAPMPADHLSFSGEPNSLLQNLYGEEDYSNTIGHNSLHTVRAAGHLLKTSGIMFSDVCMRYECNSVDTLRHVSVHITPGSRVAVIGRTGSGKSSILRVLLRLNEYHSGSVSVGGMELKQLSKRSLRQSIGVIPQNPLVFSGSVRYNLDPHRAYTDEQIMDALEKCRFYETTLTASTAAQSRIGNEGGGNGDSENTSIHIEGVTQAFMLPNNASRSVSRSSRYSRHSSDRQTALRDLLSFELTNGGENLSLGQKQLLCLGRVLLRRSELVLIDEATAAIDPVTEGILYDVLGTQLTALGSTLIMICHKQNGIQKLCNKIMEVRDGQVLSYEDLTAAAAGDVQ